MEETKAADSLGPVGDLYELIATEVYLYIYNVQRILELLINGSTVSFLLEDGKDVLEGYNSFVLTKAFATLSPVATLILRTV